MPGALGGTSDAYCSYLFGHFANPLTHAAADSIRILVSTDNHVGYNERDANRSDDSWKTFHEIMCLAKEQDVDMVLLAGDLFHDNKPSRKALFNVMRSMRLTCLGEKPCELEMLSDGSEVFQGCVTAHLAQVR